MTLESFRGEVTAEKEMKLVSNLSKADGLIHL